MQACEPVKVLIVDDQELVRVGFAMVIDSQDDLQVVGQAGDGAQAVELVRQLHPDVVLMDVRMPGMDGIEATKRIGAMQRAETPDDGQSRPTRVIVLTTFDLDEYVMAAIHAGASGFLLKDTEPETLLASIRTVHQGNAIIAPTATRRLIRTMLAEERPPAPQAVAPFGGGPIAERSDPTAPSGSHAPLSAAHAVTARPTAHPAGEVQVAGGAEEAPYTDPELDELTAREREVLIEIAHGLSNQEIAEQLFIGLPTVKTHVAHILAKINARDRVQAVVFAYENRLV
ncbi:response regulator [Bifidobacterium mongoliense]|jgi:DNA-binding NarL/FixJ family response regulator|uniref:DNA-binding response regulator n=1 Tax=Bifidobacterium mongoliense TaxID=518643 RepID=A0A423UCP7_9BIFI|nr:response regulator transcription factor [Bifidobacterium mongoliense]MDN5633312.1 response regulator transcription factor [Bifidobacterium mongoliense]MDN6026015.1 response regulator transcription factor [Bifidobacterium mongoliense]MDN6051848.1 response regulator transcription factor [Bifidobacterium mongoliense]MDN6719990.1 response regulator transcription factor [Bifidobacterium mongoliense]ROT86463.1 DNA-binding response regulator [Bifidobacterium mongoliense]